MSRPTTRNKNKRPRPDENVDPSSEILRKIHTTGEITKEDVNQLYLTWKPVCQGCRVNTRDNPNCFCGMVPPSGGSRKSGLWQKMSDIIQSLGPDPSEDLRASADTPAGLTNLGATCYANSILQCLYMNSSFREGVFCVELDVLKQYPVLDQLARLFAQLHSSKMAFIDSAAFVKTLELDNGVQQDSHEFLTLLLSLLERCLSHSAVTKARRIVQDLFRGSVSHVTTCAKCGRDSEASNKMEDFYELELNIKGFKTLDESLDDYLSIEELSGDNQYVCGSCCARVDAKRCIKLRSLPHVLNFQLKRCVFLPKTTTKKKITSSFSFPRVLDMGKRLSDSSQRELIYDLYAVLIHKGSAVNSGHYIAHIKDENTGHWWEIDDEHVSKLGHHPFGEGPSSSISESNAAAANGNTKEVAQQGSLKCGTTVQSEVFSSVDAYMLMYNLRSAKMDNQEGRVEEYADVTKREGGCLHDGVRLPSHLFEEIGNLNASYLEACKEFDMRKKRELSTVTERRQEVRSILLDAPVQGLEEPFFWIATDWLRQWADTIAPPVLDNTPIQCSHGKVPISKINSMKRLSVLAWTKLMSKDNGGPALGNADYCRDCLIDAARTIVFAETYKVRRKLMKDIANDVLSGKCEDGTYYISKSWLQQWVKRKTLDAPTEADAGPTNLIRCPHGELMPEQAAGSKRILVPENLWLFFQEDASTVKPDDTLGCSVFQMESLQCRECSHELSEVASFEDSLRILKLKQRQNHDKLASGKSIPLSLHSQYFLLPSQWILKWRSYITTGKSSSSGGEPETLNEVIDSLMCKKHSRIQERLPELVFKRGSIFQKSPATDKLTFISEHDWRFFCEEWGGIIENGVSAMIKPVDSAENPSSQEMPAQMDECDSPDVKNETEKLAVQTSPEVCKECIGERESSELMQKLSYCNEEIFVFLVRGKEAPKSILEASDSTTLESDRRMSKRSRRTSRGDVINLKVSASTSVYQLKMMIWESLGVVKENQILHKGTRIIDLESATLADMNIFPGDKLWVKDSEVHEHRDIADELYDKKMDVHNGEEGFRGTLLTADISSEAV